MADSRFILTIAGIELYFFQDLRASFPAHLHADPLAGILLSGSRLFRYGSSQRLLKAGDAIILPAFMPHSCEPSTAERTDWLCLLLRRTKARNFAPVFTDSSPLAKALIRLSAAITQEQRPAEADALVIRQLVLSLPEQPQPAESTRFKSLAASMRMRCAENASLARLAATARLDKFQLIRAFRAAQGLSPCRYRACMRLLKAQELLRQGLTLADCSTAAGYYDQSHFSRRFKAALGVTPRAYQQAWLAPIC